MSAQRCFSAFASRRGRADQHKTSVSPTSCQLIGQIGVTWRHGAERSRRCQFILREYHISGPSSLPWTVRSVAHAGYSSGFGVEPESMLMRTAVPQAAPSIILTPLVVQDKRVCIVGGFVPLSASKPEQLAHGTHEPARVVGVQMVQMVISSSWIRLVNEIVLIVSCCCFSCLSCSHVPNVRQSRVHVLAVAVSR